ncbi:MAG: SDR family NAD(P)-dependent oxidoreductase [Alphaproteobacteria bacterium TMED194]|nr:MAG: SDR family NAD(P)-dependent oxidoreductase [Alphaproteobacteria bacterium TMED194]
MSTVKKVALVFGVSGGIGNNIYNHLKSKKFEVYGFSRKTEPNSDIISEKYLKDLSLKFIEQNIKIKIFINAIGFLHDNYFSPEKKLQEINLEYMKKCFEINTIPTALMIKYFCPIMLKEEKSIFASISAKVGSISDNYLGGWYSYRASKAALNQIIKTSSIEQKRLNKNLIMVSVHPGTVNTKLSRPFIGKRKVQTPSESSTKIINLLEKLTIEDSGLFFDYNKNIIPF